MKNQDRTITTEDIEYWLGTSNPEEEAIETLVSIANGEYDPKLLKEDVIETVNQKEE